MYSTGHFVGPSVGLSFRLSVCGQLAFWLTTGSFKSVDHIENRRISIDLFFIPPKIIQFNQNSPNLYKNHHIHPKINKYEK